MAMGLSRNESLNIQLEVPPGQSCGLAVHEENAMLVISHVATQSPAYRQVNHCIKQKSYINQL